ncbi:hypothetical protein BH11MYX1_BH11MYX1_05010 [soil metagenome]
MKLALSLILVAACHPADVPSWAPDAGACEAYVVPLGTNLMAPAVSYATDVFPALKAGNCMSASCHGIHDGAQGGLYLGSSAADMYTNLVGPMAGELSTMPLVMAGHPEESYLMHKLDSDQCTLAMQCVNGNCESAMPLNNPLAAAARDTVRRWIAQGAQNN